jgi:hypothetical protein
MMKRLVKIAALAVTALVALGATAYATTGVEPDSPMGVVGAAICSVIHSILH